MSHSQCICRRTFLNEGAMLRHQSTCNSWASHLATITSNPGFPRRERKRKRGLKEIDPAFEAGPSGGISLQEQVSTPELHTTGRLQTHMEEDSMVISPPPASPLPVPILDVNSRPIRSNRGILPKRFLDVLPEGPAPLPMFVRPVSPSLEHHPTPENLSDLDKVTRTQPNTFGLIREYIGVLPLRDPEDEVPVLDLIAPQAPSFLSNDDSQGVVAGSVNAYAPYPNRNSFRIGRWYWEQPQKSKQDLRELTKIITDEGFDPSDLVGINWATIDKELGSSSSTLFNSRDGWKESTVTIKLPSGKKGVEPIDYPVDGIFHKSLTEVIHATFSSPKSLKYHYVPHKLIWAPNSDVPEQRVHGELYNSPAFINAHLELQKSPPEPGCDLPRCIAASMYFSDSTHLTDFGTASLWPIYELFGNESKYPRGQPSNKSFIHIAYVRSLPKSFDQFYLEKIGKLPTPQLQTHCKRELMHAIWTLLMDDEFREAYIHGIVVLCSDGIKRRLYPRFFTYSADYPEKVLLTTIRDMGDCPCPRCLVRKRNISAIGTVSDSMQRTDGARIDDTSLREKVSKARKLIYKEGYVVNSTYVEAILKGESLVPTENAFSKRLGDLGLQYHTMFLPDGLHEWDLGVTKMSIIHILRIVHAHDKKAVVEFNQRFNQVPPFGHDTIRHFGGCVSELKKFAARNYEDTLQCILPVIEGLLPEPHNSLVQDWLFIMAYTFNLSKLRMHTDATVKLLEAVTVEFGKLTRKFRRVTCEAYHTTELPKETAARIRRQANKAKSQGVDTAIPSVNTPSTAAALSRPTHAPSGPSTAMPPDTTPMASDTVSAIPDSAIGSSTLPPFRAVVNSTTKRNFNFNTYKFHSIGGDYAKAILEYGTIDSYSTQLAEVEHRRTKTNRFVRTSKKKYEVQLASMDIRDQRLDQLTFKEEARERVSEKAPVTCLSDEREIEGNLHDHHFIGISQKDYIDIGPWLRKHMGDRAVKDFIPRLKDHLLAQLDDIPHSGDGLLYQPEQHTQLVFRNDRIYSHQTFRINYTTYDVRRDQDLVKSSGPRRDIMVPADDNSERFWYARILGIFHVNVIDLRRPASQPTRIEFLFVRWFGREPGWSSGWKAQRLDRIGFVPEVDDNAFGFVNPFNVIRAVHLIPTFVNGRTHTLLGHSRLARGEEADDWDTFYVNRFADRDMMMRFVGGAVGHRISSLDPDSYPLVKPEEDGPIIDDADLGEDGGHGSDESDHTSDDSELGFDAL